FDVSLEVKDKSVVTVLGTNGAGKSTTLKAISRLLTSVRGSITFDKEELTSKSYVSVIKKGIVHVPEGRQIFGGLKVRENLELGAFLYSRRHSEVHEQLEYVYGLFPRLKERENQLAGTLSGGEQQMVAIGRGLMSKPKILLLDEPSLGLAPLMTRQIFAALRTLPEQGTSILLVEQDAILALDLADYAYLLKNGQVADSGPAAELRQKENVRKIYLGH
ncbi:MAG: ABC transporter ATP-binding protein, partial [Actinomycetota bacterium]